MTFVFINFIFLDESVQIVAIVRSTIKTFPRVFQKIIWFPTLVLVQAGPGFVRNQPVLLRGSLIGKFGVNPSYKRVQLGSSRVEKYEIVQIDRSWLFVPHWKNLSKSPVSLNLPFRQFERFLWRFITYFWIDKLTFMTKSIYWAKYGTE